MISLTNRVQPVNCNKVCLVCREIQKQYCPGGSFFGHLRYHIQKCLGFDYTKVPTDD